MAIFIYADESGVFDKKLKEPFVFGGVIFLNKEERDSASRKYSKVEKNIRGTKKAYLGKELKAYLLNNKEKAKIFRSLNKTNKFAVAIKT